MSNRADDFNRSNGALNGATPSDGGAAWTAVNYSVESNRLRCTALGYAYEYAYTESSSSVGEASVNLAVKGQSIGPALRVSDENGYFVLFVVGNQLQLYKRINSTTISQIGSTYSGTISAGDAITLGVDSSNQFTGYQNGTARVGPVTDSFNSAATKVGVICFSSASGARLDDFSFTDLAGGGGSYTLQVTPGSYSTTGNDVSLIAARSVQVTPGAYAITGNDVGLAAGVVLSALTGAYAYAGNDVGLTASRQLAVTAGSYSITGNVAGLNAARLLTATPGAYSISGNSVILTYNTVGSYTLNVTAGSYAITGNDVALTASRTLAVTAGSYSTTGSDVVLTYGVMHTLNVTPGAYAITGYSAMLAKALTLQALAGAYAYTGRNVVLTYSGLADGALDVVHLLSRVTPNVQLLAALTQTVRLQGHVPEFAGLSSPIP